MKRLDFILRGNGEPEEIRLEGDGDAWRLTRGGETRSFSVASLPDGRWSLLFSDGRQVCGRARRAGGGSVEVVGASGARTVSLDDPLHDRISHQAAGSGETGEEQVLALMPGRVVEVRVAEGDPVAPGQVLLVLEAMKMQNEIRAGSGGLVARCAVASGDAVETRAVLMVIRPSP